MTHSEEVVRLYDEGGLTYAQIGERFNAHPEAIRSTYRRAKGTHSKQQKEYVTSTGDEFDPSDRFITKNIAGRSPIKIAFPTDMHVPYHDPFAVRLAIQLISVFDPDILISGSDGMDFYSISTFDKNPRNRLDIADEIDLWQEWQTVISDKSPNADVYFMIGNHEDRLRKFFWNDKKASSLARIRSFQIEKILEFDEMDIVSPAIHELCVNNVLTIKHGKHVSKYSAYTARLELEREKYSINSITGHTHRGGTHFSTTRRGVIRADEGFCLCNLSPEYVPSPDWQHGTVFATVTGEQVNIEPIPFFGSGKDMFAFWRGKCYTTN